MSRWVDEMAGLVEPYLTYEVRRLSEITENEISLEDGVSFRSRKIARTFRNCTHVVAFAATIGGEIEDRIEDLTKRNRLSDMYVLDAMGSVAVEDMVDQFQENVSERLKPEGWAVTLRFSPGYCDWNIREQPTLFRVFNHESIPIRLTESCLMQPRKSVSGLFGIKTYTGTESLWDENPCRHCGKRDCIARRHEA